MGNRESLKYLVNKGVELSLINIWRNKFLSLATIFVIGILLFIFNIILAINFIAQDSLNNINKKIDVIVYLKEGTDFVQAQEIMSDLSKLEGVLNIVYTSKADALNELKKTHPDLTLAFEKYQLGNPLPASLNITTSNPKLHKKIDDFLKQDKYKIYLSNVVSNDSESNSIISSVSNNLIKLSDFTHQIIFWLILTFIIGGALITLNALHITIFSRSKEIEIMKLVGASPWFIRFPFVVEGAVYGFLSVIFSFIMLFILAEGTGLKSLNIWGSYAQTNFFLIFLIELLVTIFLTILSSLVAVHEHLLKRSI